LSFRYLSFGNSIIINMSDPISLLGNVSFTNLVIFIIIFAVASLFTNLLSIVISNLIKTKINNPRYKVPGKLVQYFLMFAVTYHGLKYILGFELNTLLATLGIFGIAVAFATQQTIQNFIAGIFILGGGIIKLDDWVEISGLPSTGLSQVKDISLTRTTLREENGRLIFVPNSIFINSKLVKYSGGDFFKVSFSLKVSGDNDLEKVRKIVFDICNKNEKILPNIPVKEKSILRKLLANIPVENKDLLSFLKKRFDPNKFEPVVLIGDINENKITLNVWIWLWEIENKDKIISSILGDILKEFSKNKIKLG